MTNRRYDLTLFIFRRDLRLDDNTALLAALKSSQTVIPCFIFDPRQYDNNPYKSSASLQFLVESLEDLDQQLRKKDSKLYICNGIAEKVVEQIITKHKINAVFFNKDYTPFSQRRDDNISVICKRHDVHLNVSDDALLVTPDQALKPDGSPYKVFSSFYRHCRPFEVAEPVKNRFQNFFQGKFPLARSSIMNNFVPDKKNNKVQKGGRSVCLKKLSNLHDFVDYKNTRDNLDEDTTQLSAHLKFTTCSIREIYHAIKNNLPQPEPLIRQLYWRDFYTFIAYFFPHVFGEPFSDKYQNIAWDSNRIKFKAWCVGRTGFPIVDAGMRQLNETGYMHNRARLITASFLVKDLHINWLWGEKYFAQHLVDYDPAVNNGNWQWVAGTGTDAQPYFRIFNPWLQQKKFDPDCRYIKHWLPELQSVAIKEIHQWYKNDFIEIDYPKPIVDHAIEAKKCKKLYQ